MYKIDEASDLHHSGEPPYYQGVATFWKTVNSADNGHIIAQFPGNNVQRGVIFAVTLTNLDLGGPKTATYSRTTISPFWAALDGLTCDDLVITGGGNGEESELVAVGDGHNLIQSLTAISVAGAMGYKYLEGDNCDSTGEIGWSTTRLNRGSITLTAFTPWDDID